MHCSRDDKLLHTQKNQPYPKLQKLWHSKRKSTLAFKELYERMPTEDWSFDLLFNNHSYSGRNILNPPKYIQPTLQDASAFSTSIKQRMSSPEKSFNPSCITSLSKHIAKTSLSYLSLYLWIAFSITWMQ